MHQRANTGKEDNGSVCPVWVGCALPMFLLGPRRALNYGFTPFSVNRLTAAGCNISPVEKGRLMSAQNFHCSYCFSECPCSYSPDPKQRMETAIE